MRRANPGRQLTEQETRFYAMGMAAARRGETTPELRLPPGQFKFWRMGWNRVQHKITNTPVFRSHDHTTQSQGLHMIRSEVATLDEALDVIAIQQRGKKASASQSGKPVDWHRELHLHNMRMK